MSDRLSDERLAEIRAAVAADPDQWDAVPSCDLLSLLDEVLEARRRIAELEAEYRAVRHDRDMQLDLIEEMKKDSQAREAQLAEMRRTITHAVQRLYGGDQEGAIAAGRVMNALDRYAIPTTPPEEEDDA